jgi:hypothetical protein
VTATAYETGPNWFDTSETFTQYAPADRLPESCGALPACAVVNAFVRSVHALFETWPIPRPIVMLVRSAPPGSVSTADVSVTETVPPLWPTVNGLNELCKTPPTGAATVPVRTSVVVGVVVGAVVDEELPPQPATEMTISARQSSVVVFMRR